MFTRVIKKIIRMAAEMSGHCDDSGSSSNGHCY
jgi:hypothetical protein